MASYMEMQFKHSLKKQSQERTQEVGSSLSSLVLQVDVVKHARRPCISAWK